MLSSHSSYPRLSVRITSRLLCALLFCFTSASLSAPAPSALTRERLRSLTEDLRQRLESPRPDELADLLRRRAEILLQLMRTDPSGVRSDALSGSERSQVLAALPGAQAYLETRGQWHGQLGIVVLDNFAAGHSETRYLLLAGDERLDLLFPDSGPLPSQPGRISVEGLRLGNAIAVEAYRAAPAPASVEAYRTAASPAAMEACTTTGEQRSLVILANMPSYTLPAGVTPSFVSDAFFGPAPSVSSYFAEVSYGLATATGTVVGPVTLPQDYSCDQSSQIVQAAVQAADALIDPTQFKRLFIVLPQIPNCGWAGLGSMGCWWEHQSSRGNFLASVSWIIATTDKRGLASVSVHEAGHNLGEGHSSSVDYDTRPVGAPGINGTWSEYGDMFSNLGSGFGHWAAKQKLRLNWLSPSNALTVEAPGAYTLKPFETPSSGPHALRIRRGPQDDSWLWLEYRQPIGYDVDLPSDAFSGVLIRYEDPSNADKPSNTALLDFTPGSAAETWLDFRDAPMLGGTTWSDPFSPLTLTLGIPTNTGLYVNVQYDTPCAALSNSQVVLGAGPTSSFVGVSAGSACGWVAASNTSWMRITAGTSGTGSGTVQFSLEENPGPAERIGALYIGRQKVTVIQAPPLQAASVEPNTGSGANQTFAFQFASSEPVAGLTAEVLINSSTATSNACHIRYDAGTRELRLRNDSDSGWLGPVPIGSGLMLRNSQCALSAAGSSADQGMFSLTLKLGLSFLGAYSGTKNLYMRATAGSSSTGWQVRGSWTVSTLTPILGVLPGAAEGRGQTFEILAGASGGATDIRILFNNSQIFSNACFVVTSTSSGYTWLMNDAGDSFGTGGIMGSATVLQNSQCEVHLRKSSFASAGGEISIRLAIWFKPSFAGTKEIHVQAYGPSGFIPLQLRGRYTVAFSSGSGPAAVFRDSATSVQLLTLSPSPQLFNGGGLIASDPAAAQSADGTTVVVGRDAWGSLWSNTFSASSSAWSGWTFGGGLTKGQPAVALGGDGKAWAVARDNWNSYWIVPIQPGVGFGGWVFLGGIFSQDPAVAACADGSLYIIGTDNWRSVWSGRYIPGTGFEGWVPGGGIIRGKPSVTCGTDGAAYVAVRDDWDSLWLARVQGNTWLGWSYGGGIMSGNPMVASARDGQVTVLLKDAGGGLWRRNYEEGTSNGWSNWTMTGGVVTDFGAASSLGDAFAAARSPGNELWWYRVSSNQWTYAGFTGIAAGPVTAAQR